MSSAGTPAFMPRIRKQKPTDWMAKALCRVAQIPTAIFYEDQEKARDICEHCPVAHDCRTYAFETEERYGIWGGVSFSDWGHPRNSENVDGLKDPRVREAYRRVWARTSEGDETRRYLRKLSDPELELLAAQEGLL